jgi:hypothetical protein
LTDQNRLLLADHLRIAMGFLVLPALVTDISAVYDVYFAAFKENAVTRALFPSATPEDMSNTASKFRWAL